MARKRYRPEEIIQKLREAEVELSQGRTTAAACKKRGVTEQTYYCWWNGNRRSALVGGGMKVGRAKCLKEFEPENARLKKLLAEAELDKAILREAAAGNF